MPGRSFGPVVSMGASVPAPTYRSPSVAFPSYPLAEAFHAPLLARAARSGAAPCGPTAKIRGAYPDKNTYGNSGRREDSCQSLTAFCLSIVLSLAGSLLGPFTGLARGEDLPVEICS